MARIVPKDWEKIYRHPLHELETFIDQERFDGTCYRAANWIHPGQTTGRRKKDQTHKVNRSIKGAISPLTTIVSKSSYPSSLLLIDIPKGFEGSFPGMTGSLSSRFSPVTALQNEAADACAGLS
jgi:hypothetical protein